MKIAELRARFDDEFGAYFFSSPQEVEARLVTLRTGGTRTRGSQIHRRNERSIYATRALRVKDVQWAICISDCRSRSEIRPVGRRERTTAELIPREKWSDKSKDVFPALCPRVNRYRVLASLHRAARSSKQRLFPSIIPGIDRPDLCEIAIQKSLKSAVTNRAPLSDLSYYGLCITSRIICRFLW